MISYMRLRPGVVLHFTLHCFISISHFVDNMEGSNYFVSVCITAWNNIVCYLASPLLCGGGLYVEALGLSAAGELDGVRYFMAVGLEEGVKNCIGIYSVALIQVVAFGGFRVNMEPL